MHIWVIILNRWSSVCMLTMSNLPIAYCWGKLSVEIQGLPSFMHTWIIVLIWWKIVCTFTMSNLTIACLWNATTFLWYVKEMGSIYFHVHCLRVHVESLNVRSKCEIDWASNATKISFIITKKSAEIFKICSI